MQLSPANPKKTMGLVIGMSERSSSRPIRKRRERYLEFEARHRRMLDVASTVAEKRESDWASLAHDHSGEG